jgi:hypothetical protein
MTCRDPHENAQSTGKRQSRGIINSTEPWSPDVPFATLRGICDSIHQRLTRYRLQLDAYRFGPDEVIEYPR